MTNIKIRLFKANEPEPHTTVTIPSGILAVASKLVPRQALDALQDKGIALDDIIRLSANPDARGVLVEVENHKKNEKIIIILEP